MATNLFGSRASQLMGISRLCHQAPLQALRILSYTLPPRDRTVLSVYQQFATAARVYQKTTRCNRGPIRALLRPHVVACLGDAKLLESGSHSPALALSSELPIPRFFGAAFPPRRLQAPAHRGRPAYLSPLL